MNFKQSLKFSLHSNFKSYLKEAAEQVDRQIDQFFNIWRKEVEEVSPSLAPLAEVFIENCDGGKRLRGALVKLGYEVGGANLDHLEGGQEILKVAAAVEIFQTAILAHDDIIDQSPLRRGKPTIFRQLGGGHYGISQTIALADIGFFLSVRLIGQADFPAEYEHSSSSNKNKAINAFAQTVINTGLGEVLDVELPHLKGERLEEDVITIHKLKTSYYTIIDPLQLGAILAGADENTLKAIEEFGQSLGIAFQIQDDILGVFGDEKTLGKSVTSDIEEGKNTLLITEALKKANSEQRQVLDKFYGKGNVGQEGLEQVRKVFMDSGALDKSRLEALKYVESAKKVILKITKDQEKAGLLSQMADFLVERDR